MVCPLVFNNALVSEMDITLDLTTPDGQTVDALARVIELRRRELGETTKQACVAMVINILRSLRAQTKVANENKMDIKITEADSKYYPSFQREKGAKGKRVSKRVLRQGKDGAVIDPGRVIWRCEKYQKGEVLHSYEVEDRISEEKTVKYILVTNSMKDARTYAQTFHKSRVKRNKSLAKYAVGLAMKAVYDKQNVNDNVSDEARTIAAQNVRAVVNEEGFNSGTVNIFVHDALDYAALALKDGENSVQTALNNAANKMIGFIQHRISQNNGSLNLPLKTSLGEAIAGGNIQ